MKSVWNEGAKAPVFEKAEGEIKTDVLIIGGGMAGILCGYMLQNAGVDCVICEADTICGGTTNNTTAKVTCQHGLIYDKLIERFGVDSARLYYMAQCEAVEKYRSLAEKIDCDFKNATNFVYSKTDRKKLEKEASALEKIGCSTVFCDKLPLPISAVGAVGIENQANINPLKFAYSIAKDLKIFERTKVLELTPQKAVINGGSIKADKIIVATHFPFINKHGSYFLKMYQHRSYVIALENAPLVRDMYVDEDEKGMSFRSYRDMLLVGGGGHRTGKDGGCWREIENFAEANFKGSRVVYRWAAQDCMTLDGVSYIGRYSKNTPSFYVATGFNKWGMTSSMVSAMILKDLILEKENIYSEIFSPSRSILHPQLAINTAEALMGILSPTAPRCPHMGCALKFNREENSWDCSCHGSRFTSSGEIIENPATDDIKKFLK